MACRARVQWLVKSHLFLDLPRHMQPPRVYRYARRDAIPNCSQKVLKPCECASPRDMSRNFTRHSESTQQRVKRPFLCLCHTISHALDLNESTISRDCSMQDSQSLEILDTAFLAPRFDKALCVTRERLPTCWKEQRKGKGRGEVSRTVQTRACDAVLIGHHQLPLALHLAPESVIYHNNHTL